MPKQYIFYVYRYNMMDQLGNFQESTELALKAATLDEAEAKAAEIVPNRKFTFTKTIIDPDTQSKG